MQNGGSARGYQRAFAMSVVQPTRGRLNVQPPGLDLYASQSCEENARICRRPRDPGDERVLMSLVMWSGLLWLQRTRAMTSAHPQHARQEYGDTSAAAHHRAQAAGAGWKRAQSASPVDALRSPLVLPAASRDSRWPETELPPATHPHMPPCARCCRDPVVGW